MAHKGQEELARMLEDARALVDEGALYVHFKHPDQAYAVAGFAILESTEEVCVLYRAQYGEGVTFIRPLESFVAIVEQEGRSVPRFQKVD